MYDKIRTILVISALFVGFLLLGRLTNYDLFRYPFGMRPSEREREKGAILATIGYCNRIYTDLYTSDGTPAMLNALPSIKSVRQDIFRDIGFLRQHDRILIYDMAEIVPVVVRVMSPITAEAIVLELWNYQYQKRGSRTPLVRSKGMGQGFRYDLIKIGGAWIIKGWSPVSVEEPEIKEFRF